MDVLSYILARKMLYGITHVPKYDYKLLGYYDGRTVGDMDASSLETLYRENDGDREGPVARLELLGVLKPIGIS